MRLLEQIEKINRLHSLIRHKSTGTPEQLAAKMQISRSGLFRLLDELRVWDAPIEYSRTLKSYYYSGEDHPKVLVELHVNRFGK